MTVVITHEFAPFRGGADAAPYFRIFNPATQAGKFDPQGQYVGRCVPEFGAADYPRPIIDHAKARARALNAFEDLKKQIVGVLLRFGCVFVIIGTVNSSGLNILVAMGKRILIVLLLPASCVRTSG